jgi:hypothetical protein
MYQIIFSNCLKDYILHLGGSGSGGYNTHDSTSGPKRLSCDGRACNSCGKCRDWEHSGYVINDKIIDLFTSSVWMFTEKKFLVG